MELFRIPKGTTRVRILPWHYDDPFFDVRACVATTGSRVGGTCPSTFGDYPDPLYAVSEERGREVGNTIVWSYAVVPVWLAGEAQAKSAPETALFQIPRSVQRSVAKRVCGTLDTAPWRDPEDLLASLRGMDPTLRLGDALRAAEPPPVEELKWIVEPCDVTDPDEGLTMRVVKKGEGVHTRIEVEWEKPSALPGALRDVLVTLSDESFDARSHLPPFDYGKYLYACGAAGVELSPGDADALRRCEERWGAK